MILAPGADGNRDGSSGVKLGALGGEKWLPESVESSVEGEEITFEEK